MTSLLRFSDCRSYQGRNIVTSSASAAITAMRCSGASAPQAREMRVMRLRWGRRVAWVDCMACSSATRGVGIVSEYANILV